MSFRFFASVCRRNRPWRSSREQAETWLRFWTGGGSISPRRCGCFVEGNPARFSPFGVGEHDSLTVNGNGPARRTLTTFEQEGRRVFALEIEPTYVDVFHQRM